MADSGEKLYYNVSEAARVLEVSPSTIWRWIAAAKLPAYRIGPRTIRIKKDDLAAMMRPARPPDAAPRAPSNHDGKGIAGVRESFFTPPSAEELARRQALVAKILANREKRGIAPLTSADLVRQVRDEAERSDGASR